MKLYFEQSLYERRTHYEKTFLDYFTCFVYGIVSHTNAGSVRIRL